MANQAIETNVIPAAGEEDTRPVILFAGEVLREPLPGYIMVPHENGTFGLIPLPGPYAGHFDAR